MANTYRKTLKAYAKWLKHPMGEIHVDARIAINNLVAWGIPNMEGLHEAKEVILAHWADINSYARNLKVNASPEAVIAAIKVILSKDIYLLDQPIT